MSPPGHLLQEAERNLCGHLNTLAMRLLAKADAMAGGAGSSQARLSQAGDAAVADELAPASAAGRGEGEPGSPPPAKRARKSKGGFDGLGREALRAQALLFLGQSFRVAEKGIAGEQTGQGGLCIDTRTRRPCTKLSWSVQQRPLPLCSRLAPWQCSHRCEHGPAEGDARHRGRLHLDSEW